MTGAAYSYQLGQAAQQIGRLDEAITHYKAVLEVDLDHFPAAHMLGMLLVQQRDFKQAEIYLNHAASLNGEIAAIHYALGLVHTALERPGDALLAYERALLIKPDFPEALNNRGIILKETILCAEARICFERALALKPDSSQARHNLETLRESQNSIAYSARGYFNLGFALRETGRFVAALSAYDTALKIDPELPYLRGEMLHVRMEICDWQTYSAECDAILHGIDEDRPVIWPFHLLSITSDPSIQLTCARSFAAREYPAGNKLAPLSYKHDRKRIAYLSSDFRNHPVGILLSGIIAHHDRKAFEVFGISTGPDDGSEWRKKLSGSFDRFLDASQMGDDDVAIGIRELEIDILIDLNGYTTGSRMGILAQRPAPVQVSFLGYAATTGADFIDYILADRTAVPQENEKHYAERVAALPFCCLPTLAKPIAQATPDRASCGLPANGFVFCAFNSSFKITPDIFALWMRLLNGVPGSVLWLRQPGDLARNNLLAEAQRAGIASSRLVFAQPVRHLEDHLARHRFADLFLDTQHYNAHSTAADALWAGLPVLTCPGGSYASRVSASLLTALGLTDMIASSLREYENIALALAREPAKLTDLKERLAKAKETSNLFDGERYTRALEDAYRAMLPD